MTNESSSRNDLQKDHGSRNIFFSSLEQRSSSSGLRSLRVPAQQRSIPTVPIFLSMSPMKDTTQNQTSPMVVEMTEPDQSHIILTKTQTDMLSSLLAGLGSGTLSSIACAPLDLIRTRMQVMGELNKKSSLSSSNSTKMKKNANIGIIKSLKKVFETEGVRGCFRGLAPTLLTVPAFWGIYFPFYEIFKKELNQRYIQKRESEGRALGMNSDNGIQATERLPPLIHMSSAILSGAIADFVCNPMFVVRTRMQTEALHYLEMPIEHRKPHGIARTIKGLYQEGGVPIFWRGLTASLLGLSHVGIQFPVYEYLKAEARQRSSNNEESAFHLLLASGTSKMVATSLTYPHEVVRSRMMDFRGGHEEGQKQTLRNTFMRIIRNEGYRGLYTGISVSLVRVVPNCCITFISYELILRWTKSQFS